MEEGTANTNILTVLNLFPDPAKSTETSSDVQPDPTSEQTPMAVEQPVSTLSTEQMSLLLQKVLTKERLKAILVQESVEDKKEIQSLQEDLDEANDNMNEGAQMKESLQKKLLEAEENIKEKTKNVQALRCELRELETKEEKLKKKKDACDMVAENIKKRIRSCKYLIEQLPTIKKKPVLQYTSMDLQKMLAEIDAGEKKAANSGTVSTKQQDS